MRKWFAGVLWVGAGLCGSGFTPIACLPHVCTLVGCSDSEQLTFRATVDQVSDTQVSACRNARCWHGSIAAADLTTIAAQHRLSLAPDDGSNASIDCIIETPLPAGTARFTFIWENMLDPRVSAGDVLSATFTDASGNAVLSAKGTIRSFEEYFPNGEDCDDEGCRTASVQGRVD
jgi:hypothetical protein